MKLCSQARVDCMAYQIMDSRAMFRWSAFLFRTGLGLETFEAIRPGGVLLADFAFGASLLLLLSTEERNLLKSKGSGIMLAAFAIVCGALLSGITGPGIKLFILFGLFAPLAIAHAKNIRANLLYLVTGTSFNCFIAMLSAAGLTGAAKTLAITDSLDDLTSVEQDSGRLSGLAGHPVHLGFCAALAILIAVGLLSVERNTLVRWWLYVSIMVCTIGAIISGSRSFIVPLVPALLILLFWEVASLKAVLRKVAFGTAAIFIFWSTLAYAAPEVADSYIERLSRTSSIEEPENYQRLLSAGIALDEISQKPIMGWGMQKFGEAGMIFLPWDGIFMPAHNIFLHYWYAEGILGAIGFLMLFILPVRRMLQNLKRSPDDRFLRLGVCVFLLLFIVSNVNPVLTNRFVYMPLFVFAGLCALAPSSRLPSNDLHNYGIG